MLSIRGPFTKRLMQRDGDTGGLWEPEARSATGPATIARSCEMRREQANCRVVGSSEPMPRGACIVALLLASDWCAISAQGTALNQSGTGQDAAHNLNSVITHQPTVLRSQQCQSSATSVAQSDRYCEMLARVKGFNGDDDKLFAEYQEDSESDQPGECRQELKDRVADSLRVRLHAERECCFLIPQTQIQWNIDNRKCERCAYRLPTPTLF